MTGRSNAESRDTSVVAPPRQAPREVVATRRLHRGRWQAVVGERVLWRSRRRADERRHHVLGNARRLVRTRDTRSPGDRSVGTPSVGARPREACYEIFTRSDWVRYIRLRLRAGFIHARRSMASVRVDAMIYLRIHARPRASPRTLASGLRTVSTYNLSVATVFLSVCME